MPGEQDRVVAGRYRLLAPLGRGGMGTVWHGWDEVLGRDVAIKEVLLPPGLPDAEREVLRKRTIREAQTAARLSHPSVVTVYDVVEEAGQPWIVMELVRARALSQVIAEGGPLPVARTAEIGRQVLAALMVAHAAGVLHRDVKPGNVLLADSGRVVLTDFGIATVTDDPSLTSLTQSGVVLGSPAYMSPERARGERATMACDLWSLGATLYAAVEGRPPYEREGPIPTLAAVMTEDPDPPRRAGPLAPLLAGLLTRDPARRLGAVEAFRMLDQVAVQGGAHPAVSGPQGTQDFPSPTTPLAGPRADSARPTAAPPRPRPDDARRSRRALVPLTAIFALLIVAGAGAWMALGPRGHAVPTAGRGASPTATAGQRSPTASGSPATTPIAIPPGFQKYTDPTGFALAVPTGWRPAQRGQSVFFYDDQDPRRYLQIDQTRQPGSDALANWQVLKQQTLAEGKFPGYQEIRLEPVRYIGLTSADWEFTWRPADGVTRHVLDRGFVPDTTHGYGILVTAPEDQWPQTREILDTVFATFRPA